MFLLSVGDENLQLLKAADRIARFVLGQLLEYSACDDPHKRAIMVTQIASQMLQAAYPGPDSVAGILIETAIVIDAFTRPVGDA